MIFENAKYHKELFHGDDLYIFAIGYEYRSSHLYDRLSSDLGSFRSMIFAFDDFENYGHTQLKIEELKKKDLHVIIENYDDSQSVQAKIVETVKEMVAQNDSITVHIDYSSMPRSWYCELPAIFQSIIRKDDRVYFWYSEGEYPASYEEYPSAGIDAFSFFSGKPSLQIENNRIHILALGYDAIRTQAIISITDPDYLVACYAYNPNRDGFPESIKKANHHILSRAAMSVALHLDDFSFMVSKLRETTSELLPTGDVILIPDGPKPLIFAISLIPDLVNKNGVTCLHVARNSKYFKPIDVTPTGVIYGFSMQVE